MDPSSRPYSEIVIATDNQSAKLLAVQRVSERINRAHSVSELLESALETLHEAFGFDHSRMLVVDEQTARLTTVAERGRARIQPPNTISLGQGLIGEAAEQQRVLTWQGSTLDSDYRARFGLDDPQRDGECPPSRREKRLVAVPVVFRDRLIGALAFDGWHASAFSAWHETVLKIISDQLALGMERLAPREHGRSSSAHLPRPAELGGACHVFSYYAEKESVFVDGDYLIRNIPGKILWKILQAFATEGRSRFSNRELRLDLDLGLPHLKANLETRLILLRRRLEEKCPRVRLVPTARGQFELVLNCQVKLHVPT